jgi:hypothetical protein
LVRGSAAFFFEFLPVVAALMRFRSPGWDEVAFTVVAVGVDDWPQCRLPTDRVGAHLLIIEAVVHSFHHGALEDASCVLESQAMTADVDAVLLGVPSEAHLKYIYEMSLHKSSDTPGTCTLTARGESHVRTRRKGGASAPPFEAGPNIFTTGR